MTTNLPPRSLPPPKLPPALFARARIRTLGQELLDCDSAEERAQLHFELGMLHEDGLGDAFGAQHHYRRALEHAATLQPALLSLLRLRLSAEHGDDEAVALLRVLAQRADSARTRAALRSQAGLLLRGRLGRSGEATDLWEQALGDDPSAPLPALMLEHRYLDTGRTRDAERVLELRARACGDAALRAQYLIELALRREAAGEIDAALSLLQEAAGCDENSTRPLRELSRLGQRDERPQLVADALSALAQRLAARPGGEAGAAACYWQSARVRARALDDPRRALSEIDRALLLCPSDSVLRSERIELRARTGDRQGVAADVDMLLAAELRGPERAELLLRRAEVEREAGDAVAALSTLAAAVGADPNSAAAVALFEDGLLDAGRFAELREHLLARAEHASRPARAELYLRAGRIECNQLHAGKEALSLFERAVASANDARPYLRELYGAALLVGDTDRARWAAERLCEGDLEPEERSILLFDLFQRRDPADDDGVTIVALLRQALTLATASAWAPPSAALWAAENAEYELLARAHRALADQARDKARAGAELCAAARALSRTGDRATAIQYLREALECTPGNSYALALLEECLLMEGAAEEAAEVMQGAAEQLGDTRKREIALLRAGVDAEAAGDLDKALSCYRAATETEPSSLSGPWALRRLAERRGDWALLDEVLSVTVERAEASSRGREHLELAELRLSRGEFERAMAPLHAALGDSSVTRAAALHASLLPEHLTRELHDPALSLLAARESGPSARAFTRERIAAAFARDPAHGRELLAEALAARPDDPWLALRAFFSADNRLERARSLLRLSQTAAEPALSTELALHALRCLRLWDPTGEEALVNAQRVAQRAAGSLPGAVALDEAIGSEDDPELRIEALVGRLSHANAHSSTALRTAYARALLRAGQARAAADAAQHALAQRPKDVAACEILHAAARELGDFATQADAAERLARKARLGERAELYEEAALAYARELGRTEDAVRCLREALRAAPERESSFALLHDLLIDGDRLSELDDLLGARLSLQMPNARRVELLYESALVRRAAGRKRKALAPLYELLDLDPDHVAGLGLLAEVHTSLEEFGDAVNALRRMADAPVPEGQLRLARIGAADFLDRKLGEPEQAYRELAKLAAAGLSDLEVLRRMAQLAQRAGLYREAVMACEEAAAWLSGPECAEMHRRAAVVLEKHLGEPEAALEQYAEALAAFPADSAAAAGQLALTEDDRERETLAARFTDAVLEALREHPLDPELVRKLSQAARWRRNPGLELVSLATLEALGQCSEVERRALSQLRTRGRPAPKQLPEAELAALLPPAQSPAAELCELLGGVLWELDASVIPAQPATERDDSDAPVSVHAELEALARAMSSSLHLTQRGASHPDAIQLEPGLGHSLRFRVGERVQAPLAPWQRFEAVRQLAAAARATFGWLERSPEERDDALLAARLSAGDRRARTDSSLHASRALNRLLPRATRKRLAQLLSQLEDPKRALADELDHRRRIALRAAMLLSDDLDSALATIVGTARVDVETLSTVPDALALIRFWLSPEALALRRALGWDA